MERLTRAALEHPRTALAALLAVTALLAAGLPRVHSAYGYRVLVGDEHPSIRALDALIAQFGGGLPVQIAWECGDGAACAHVFDAASLEMADAVTRALSAAGGVREVYGPANAPLLVPLQGGFAIRRFVESDGVREDAPELGRRALADPLWRGRLVSADARLGVISVQPSDTRPATDMQVVDAILAALAPFEVRGFRFHLAGDAAENYLGGLDLASGNARLVPFALLVMGAMLYALSRSALQTLAVLATMGVALVWTFGLLGWLGWPRDGILEVLAALLLVVGVCDSMHLVASVEAFSGTPSERLCAAARDVGGACAFATLTDAGAFASFATSSLDTFVRFGAISAFGVLATLLLTFTLLPLAIAAGARGGAQHPETARAWSAALRTIAPLAERRRHAILAVSACALLGFGFSWWTLLQVDTDWLETWGDRNERTRSIRLIQDRLGSAKTLELRLAAPGGELEPPDALAAVQRLARELDGVEQVSGTRSVVDLIARMNRLVHDDDPAFERAPESPEAAAELLELLSLDDASVLAPWVSVDRRQFRVSVETRELPYQTGRGFVAAVRAASRRALPAGWEFELTGEIPMTVDWVEDVQATQLRGFPTAVLTVYLMIAVFLRSFRLALGALLPTLIPIVVTLGSMGLLGLDLDVGRAMIGSVVIGIGVDDAIHLASQYRARRREGSPPRAALAQAIEHSGRAIVTNSLTLALGFLTLMVSPWQSISSFGFFAALTIVGALVSTLLVMPALIFAFQRERSA